MQRSIKSRYCRHPLLSYEAGASISRRSKDKTAGNSKKQFNVAKIFDFKEIVLLLAGAW
jgi:hypothetical protein